MSLGHLLSFRSFQNKFCRKVSIISPLLSPYPIISLQAWYLSDLIPQALILSNLTLSALTYASNTRLWRKSRICPHLTSFSTQWKQRDLYWLPPILFGTSRSTGKWKWKRTSRQSSLWSKVSRESLWTLSRMPKSSVRQPKRYWNW